MLLYSEVLENDLTEALQLSGRLQDEVAIRPQETLENKMAYLSLGFGPDAICILGYDFAPMSFTFSLYVPCDNDHPKVVKDIYVLKAYPMLKNHQLLFHGGLIFHGNHDGYGSGAAPTFSVSLTPTNGWSVHT